MTRTGQLSYNWDATPHISDDIEPDTRVSDFTKNKGSGMRNELCYLAMIPDISNNSQTKM